MTFDCFPSPLYTLRSVADGGIDWPALHRRALAAGAGELVDRYEERVAGADELLGRALGELLILGELAAFASFPPLAEDCRRPLARSCGALIRLLDRALSAHARDVGYRADVWRRDTAIVAAVAASAVSEHDEGEPALPAVLRRAAEAMADALVALPRDRLDVPGQLTTAGGQLLVAYAAAIG